MRGWRQWQGTGWCLLLEHGLRCGKSGADTLEELSGALTLCAVTEYSEIKGLSADTNF